MNGGTSQSGPYHADTSTGPLLDLSADILIFTGTNQTGWQFAATGPGLSGYIGGIDISSTGTSSSFQAITSGFPVIGTFARSTSFTAPVWHHIDLLLNIPAQTYNITFDGSLLASSVPFCGDNGTCAGATVPTYADGFFDSFGVTGGGNDSGYMDNYLVQTVSSVPEPAAVSLVTLGLLAVGARIRRR